MGVGDRGGTWTIHVGRNVEDTPLSATLEVEGTRPRQSTRPSGHYLNADVAGVPTEKFAVLLGRRSRGRHHGVRPDVGSDPCQEHSLPDWRAANYADKAKAGAKGIRTSTFTSRSTCR